MDRGFGNFSNPASVSGGRPFGGYKMPQSNPSITHPGVGSSSSGGANYQGNFDQDAQRSREMGYSYKHEEAKQGERIEGGSSQSLRDVLHSIHGQDNVMSDNLNGVTERMKSIVNWSYAHGKKDLNHIKSIDLSGGRFNGDVLEFCKVMNCSHFSLHSIHLNDNGNAFGDKELDVVIKAIRGGKSRAYEHITSEPVSRLTAVNVSSSEFKYSPEDNRFIQQKITYLNLSNCNLTDVSADMIASSLTYGDHFNHPIQARYLVNTKVIDVSGNNITAKGEGCFYTAFDKIGNHRDLAVILHSYRSYEPSGQKDKILPKITNFLGKAKEYYLKIGKDALDKKILEHEELYGWTGIHKIAADPNKPKWYFCDKTKDNVSWEANCAIVKCAPSLFIGGLPKYFQCVSLDTSSGFIHKETLGCFVEVFDNLRDNSIKETSIQETELAGGSCDIF